MSVMIKLRLKGQPRDLHQVQQLPGLHNLALDPDFGLLCISPKDSLYVVRTDQIDHADARKEASPEIVEWYGDTRISATEPSPKDSAARLRNFS